LQTQAQITFQSNGDQPETAKNVLRSPDGYTNPLILSGRTTGRGSAVLQFMLVAFPDWTIQLWHSGKLVLTGPVAQLDRVQQLIQGLALVIVPTADAGKREWLKLEPIHSDLPDEKWREIWRKKVTPVTAASAPLVKILRLEGKPTVIFVDSRGK